VPGAFGAVYRPDIVIEPLAVPSCTVQFTPVLFVPVTVATKA
jgi:hypothetical protein